MKKLAIFLVTIACLSTACSRDSETGAEQLSSGAYLQRCRFQALSLGFTVAGEEVYADLQSELSSRSREDLTPELQVALDALANPVRIGGLTYTPIRSTTEVDPSSTSLDEFREKTGLLEYLNYMTAIGAEFNPSVERDLNLRFYDPLTIACDSHEAEFLQEACTAGDSEACRLVDNLDQLDPAVVAEACELTPYMLFCDPEDPIPWELPPLEE